MHRIGHFAFAVSLLAGCDAFDRSQDRPPKRERAERPAPPLKPAPQTEWTMMGGGYFKFKGDDFEYGTEVRATVLADGLHLDSVKLPEGTVLSSGELSSRVDGPFTGELVIPVADRLANEPWEVCKQRIVEFDWAIPFTVAIPGYEPVETVTPPMTYGLAIEGAFERMATDPTGWPGESGPGDERVPAAAAWLGTVFAALGKAETIGDVRFIATTERIPNDRTKRCTGYAGAPDFRATSHDETIRIVDRLTGEVLAEKTFKGRTGCPSMVASGPTLAPSHSEGPSVKAMKKWVKGQLPKLARKLSTG